MGASPPIEILLAIIVSLAICHGQECDPNGVSCINCTDYRKCSGGAPKGPIFSCRSGVDCNEQPSLELCRIKLNCYALNECTEVGIFPDATVESNYFVCLPDSGSGFVKYDFACPEGEFFDKTAKMCIASAASSASTLPPTAETTTAASPSSDTTVQTPAATSATPVPTSDTTIQTPVTTSTTPVPTPETTAAVSSTTSASPPPFACTAPGIFPNPTNCKMYFRCSTSLKVFYYICPGASYFNENILKCSLIITPACQQQILQNTTTLTTPMTTTSTTPTTPTPPPTITTTSTPPPTTATTSTPPPTATTTSTPPPTATTTSTPPSTATTTTRASTTPFSCSAAGTFENPLDCKTYYRCSSSGKTFLFACPNDSYYNEVTKRCSLTITPRCRSKLKE